MPSHLLGAKMFGFDDRLFLIPRGRAQYLPATSVWDATVASNSRSPSLACIHGVVYFETDRRSRTERKVMFTRRACELCVTAGLEVSAALRHSFCRVVEAGHGRGGELAVRDRTVDEI